MKYSKIELQCEDIMWFGVDKNGIIFECTSGGLGCVPSFVCDSKEETELLEEYFLDIPDECAEGLYDNNESDDLFQDCIILSSKGIFCYDVAVDEERIDEYRRISEPVKPLTINDLPDDIKEIMNSHKVDVDVTKDLYISVEHAY